jgi:hypothetical protein
LIRQPVLSWPVTTGEDTTKEDTTKEDTTNEDTTKEDITKEDTGEQVDSQGEVGMGCLVMEGAEEDDKETYRKFLEYCEERRRSWTRQEEEDEARQR